MSITAAELIAYASANLPTDDVSTTGGAIDATRRPVFTQISSAEKLDFASSAADVRNVTIVGRDSTGASISETIALNGTTTVTTVNTYARILSVNAASANANTVTCKGHTSATTFASIFPNEVGFYMLFQNAFSAGTTETRYEKFFWKNTDATLTLTSSQITLTVDSTGLLSVGCAPSVSDSATVANRLSVPASVVFVGLSTAQNVPGGNIAAAAAIGVWVKQALGINQAAQTNPFTTQLSGNTT